MEILIESALRATALAAVVGVLLKVLRIASPRPAHAAWSGVAVVMLLLPAVVAWAPEAPLPVLGQPDPAGAAIGVDSPGSVAGGVGIPPAPAARRDQADRFEWEAVVLLLYASGVAFLLFRLGLGVRQARMLVGSARMVNGRLTHPRCVTPVTVGLFAPVVILPPAWVEWPPEELAAVLAHEDEHVRRRDPLLAFLTMLNRAVFWFHPLSWWLPRQVSRLSEHACDEVVISRGHDEQMYAKSLLKFAKAAAGTGRRIAPLGTAMPGSALPARLRLLASPAAAPASAARLSAVAATYVLTVAVCSAATPTTAASVSGAGRLAQGQSPAGGGPAGAWQVRTTEHFDIFYEATQSGRIDGVIRQAEAAYAQLSNDFKYELRARVPLIVLARDSDLSNAAKALRETGSLDSGRVSQPPLPDDTGQRIVLSLESLDTQAGIVVHELTHQFMFEILPDRSRTAPWLVEGLAEHARGLWNPDDFRRMREAVARGLIPPLDRVGASDRHWGHALFDFVAAQYGAEGVRRYLFALRKAATPADAIAVAFEIPAGTTFDDVFRAYVTQRFGGG